MGQSAQKIVNLDHKNLLELLNVAFAEEWLAYYQYWIGAKIICGFMGPNVQEEFEKHAKEELEHAEKIATRIIQLGGVPLLAPAEWEKYAKCKYETPVDDDVISLLKQNLESERCAISRYQQICDMCFGKDHETYRISIEILEEEIDHEQDWENFLADIERYKTYLKTVNNCEQTI